jgi:uncharacterized membrane protein
MSPRLRLISRIALFSALIYVLSWGTASLPNVKLMFFVIFAAGFLWGGVAGLLVGAIGMALWTLLNPFGPAPLPIMAAQIVGASAGGLTGAVYRNWYQPDRPRWAVVLRLILASVLCTTLFYLPVNVVDAWLFQPFWPRFITGLLWAGISLASNALIFPLLFKAAEYLYAREGTAL